MQLLIDACQEALRPCTDHEYEPSNTQGSNEVDPDDAAMDMDDDLVETTRSQEQFTLSSPFQRGFRFQEPMDMPTSYPFAGYLPCGHISQSG